MPTWIGLFTFYISGVHTKDKRSYTIRATGHFCYYDFPPHSTHILMSLLFMLSCFSYIIVRLFPLLTFGISKPCFHCYVTC